MFTGIIECLGIVQDIVEVSSGKEILIKASIGPDLKIDQSVAHNGVCLTVVEVKEDVYRVVAIKETLSRSNLGSLIIGDSVNLERCVKMNSYLDGHLVQGHVDLTATCTNIKDEKGSWLFDFEYSKSENNSYITVEKGSVCINGVSLTVVKSGDCSFSVAIIPYTYEHTNFNTITIGSKVNIEFDIIGKYIAKLMLK